MTTLNKIQEAWQHRSEWDCNEPVETGLSDEDLSSILTWLDHNNKVCLDIKDGSIYFREISTEPHGAANGALLTEISVWDMKYGGKSLRIGTRHEVKLGTRTILNPDLLVTPKYRDAPSHQPASRHRADISFPTLVVEVGWEETVQSLHASAEYFFSAYTEIQLYLAVHLWPRDEKERWQGLIFLYERNAYRRSTYHSPIAAVSFGTAPLAHQIAEEWKNEWHLEDIPHPENSRENAATIQIPVSQLYDTGNVKAPSISQQYMDINLYDVQRSISRVIY